MRNLKLTLGNGVILNNASLEMAEWVVVKTRGSEDVKEIIIQNIRRTLHVYVEMATNYESCSSGENDSDSGEKFFSERW